MTLLGLLWAARMLGRGARRVPTNPCSPWGRRLICPAVTEFELHSGHESPRCRERAATPTAEVLSGNLEKTEQGTRDDDVPDRQEPPPICGTTGNCAERSGAGGEAPVRPVRVL